MVVRVKWFYHPEETQGGGNLDKLKYPVSRISKNTFIFIYLRLFTFSKL